MSWFRDTDGTVYADTDFINKMQSRLKDCELKHRGFGEFTFYTPKGSVEFIRTEHKNIPGQSGRSHLVRGADGAVALLLAQMKDDEKLSYVVESTPTMPPLGAMPTVPCKTCGEPTTFTGTKQCDDCHEVETRLEGYLRRGGEKAQDFVEVAAITALYPPGHPKCPCGRPTIDGKATCGLVRCGVARSADGSLVMKGKMR